jgi:hypothetical protein
VVLLAHDKHPGVSFTDKEEKSPPELNRAAMTLNTSKQLNNTYSVHYAVVAECILMSFLSLSIGSLLITI